MTFLNPAAFYLLLASLLILILHFLHARERQREVSALFLWEGLPGDPQSRAARIRQQVDPLLLLQLAILLVVVTALAQPAWRMRTASLSGLAIVLDGSASMQTTTEDGSTRYDHAVDEARSLLDQYPSTTTAAIQLSARPAILARPGLEHTDLQDAILRSEPTWYGDGTAAALLSLLGSIGGTSRFQRVVILSDHPSSDMPDSFETILVDGGDNLALTGFSVRENPEHEGVTALVTALNETDAYQDVTIRIDDRENQTTLSTLMAPGSAERFIIPFPNSRGTLFTASLEPEDDFAADNRRFFSLDRPIDVRVHWLGSENRYVMAALRSVAPVTLVDAPEDADLTVVHGARAPASQAGTVLLVHAGIEGLLTQGETLPTDRIEVLRSDHPILNGVDPSNFRVREAPTASLPPSAEVVLATGDVPLLATYTDETRTVFYLAPNILETNLPITIDFPLLMRNIIAGLVRLPPQLSYRSADVGEPVPLAGRGAIEALYDAQEKSISLPDGLSTLRPASPGFHTLITDRGAFAIAVNVPTEESSLPPASPTEIDTVDDVDRTAVRFLPLWPSAAGLAIVLLLAEAYLHSGRRSLMRRAR
jgi:Ca-activated chloride channel family protein